VEHGRVSRWPWITLIIAALAHLNPLGLDLLRQAFAASEQLARTIAQAIYGIALVILLALIALEWTVRWWLARRRGAMAQAQAGEAP